MGTSTSRTKGVPEGVSVQEYIDSLVNEHTITVFSKSYCPYCRSAKSLLQKEYADQDIEIVELDQLEDGSTIQDALEDKTGQRTVPNIFVKKQHIGGNDDTQAAHRAGKLKELHAV